MLRNANKPSSSSGNGAAAVSDLDFNQLTPAQIAAITAQVESANGNEVKDSFGNDLGTFLPS